MFSLGSILYFEPFYFANGDEPKNKYFLVIKHVDTHIVLASLPTSQDHIPSHIEPVHGCIEDASINFNCYHFKEGCKVAKHSKGEFAFPKDTYVYGYRIDEFDTEEFCKQIELNQTKVTQMGILYQEEFAALISCLKHSSSVKRKYKKLL